MTSPDKPSPTRRRVVLAAKIAVTALLLFLLYRKVDGKAFAELFAKIDWRWPMLFFAIAFLNMGISSVRWRLFLRADNVDVPTSKLFASHWIASFCNFFLPSNVGGDLYRIADIGAKSGSAVRGTASVFMDRLSGFLAMSFLGFVFPLAGLRMVPREHWPWLLVPVAFFLVFAGLFALVVFGQGLLCRVLRLLPGRVGAKAGDIADRFLASVSAYSRRPSVPLAAFGLSILFQFLVFVAIWTAGRALRIPVPFAWYCVFAPLVCILESLPVSINGMGLREAAYVVFFGIAFPLVGFAAPEGVAEADWPKTCAGAMALCYMALTLAYACGGGLLLLRRMFRKSA